MIELNESQKNLNRNHLFSNDTVISNIKAILYAHLKQVDKAIKELQTLLTKTDSQTNKFNIFPSTMAHLDKNSLGFEKEMRAFYPSVKGRLFSVKWDILPFSEHLTNLAIKHKYEQKTDMTLNKNKNSFNKEITLVSKNEPSITQSSLNSIINTNQVQHLGSQNSLTNTSSVQPLVNERTVINTSQSNSLVLSYNNKLDSQIERLEAILERIDQRLVVLDKRVKSTEKVGLGQKEFTQILDETYELYKAMSYSDVIKNCHQLIDSYAAPENSEIKRRIINMLIFSISKCEVRLIKRKLF